MTKLYKISYSECELWLLIQNVKIPIDFSNSVSYVYWGTLLCLALPWTTKGETQEMYPLKDIPAQWAKIRQGLDIFGISSKYV